jgi:hypothetical protein
MKRAVCIVFLSFSVLFVSLCQSSGPTSFWTNTTIPSTSQVTNDTAAVTLGLQFYSDVAGSVTAVRFYKGANNTGTHIGNLWSSTGTKLAEVTFSGESASGWQQANFSSPVNIAPNTTYVISYLAPKGSYESDQFYSWSTLNASPLHVSGSSPGVFVYGSTVAFPEGTWNSSNYSVDLVFNPSSTSEMFWTNSTVPGTPEVTETASVTLGLQFYSDVAGSVTAVRFYKGPHNTGTHVGNLWSGTGTKLAEVTFSGETASGWQQANFSSPVTIAPNTTYVISYLAPNGYYADDQSYSWSTLNAARLHVSGSSPGVYAYGSSVLFPKSTWKSSNYSVDLVFNPASIPNPASTYSISGIVNGSAAKLTLSGAVSGSTNTDGTGNYSFSGLTNGSYVLAASQSGYTFTPSIASVSINGASIRGVNFTATPVSQQPPAAVSHSVSLTWVSSTSPNIKGYNVYRSTVSGGTYTKLTASPVAATSYVDSNVASGQTYSYVATTVDSNDRESTYSTEATAQVPTP